MPGVAFEAFKAELNALRRGLSSYPKKTLRDDAVRDRFRTLFRSWSSVVEPTVRHFLASKRELYKLAAEIEALAKLTSKVKPCTEYRKRLARAISLTDSLVLYLPPNALASEARQTQPLPRQELFVLGIPDLPVSLVPNPLLGWKSSIEQFLKRYPFDRSVFVMVRYRERNADLIKTVREEVAAASHTAILASDHNVTDDLYNAIACLLCCAKGLAIFDQPNVHQTFNPNVAYELGMMHLLGRECRILKHAALDVLHTDILMKLYHPFKDLRGVREHIRTWLGSGSD